MAIDIAKKIKHEKSFLYHIINEMPIGVLVLDAAGRVLVINERQEKISKVNGAQVLGTYFHETWNRLFDEGHYGENYWKLINQRIPFSLVFHEVLPQFYNEKVTGIAHGVPLSNGDGCVLVHDISEEMRRDKSALGKLAAELRESSEFLTNLIDSSPNAVIVTDEAGVITFSNETVESYFGFPRSDMLGKNIAMLFETPIDPASLSSSKGGRPGFESNCLHRNGLKFPVQIQFNRFFDTLRKTESSLFVIKDISVEKEMSVVLEERLNFERLLSELSATFVNLPPEFIDTEINHGLERICRFLGVERSGLFQFTKDDEMPYLSHTWTAEGFEMAASQINFKGFPYFFRQVQNGNVVKITQPDDLPADAAIDRESFKQLNARSYLGIPLIAGSSNLGHLGFGTVSKNQTWPDDLVNRLKLIAETFANALLRKRSQASLDLAFKKIKTLKDQIEAERNYLREEIKLEHNFEEIIGNSSAIQYALFKVEQVSPTDTTVLIQGETGTGKELIARAIHHASSCKERPLIKVNCATLPANLIESELFGHEKGAFTGAHAVRVGRFELANQSTIFLDEIGEMPLELQPKLLRVLQDGEFERLGGTRTINVKTRVITATNRNLEQEVQQGRFRKDLWYRLNVFPITVPPLRNRKEDVPLLVNHFVKRFCKRLGRTIDRIDTQSMAKLTAYDWPGNVRELQNVIERLVINNKGNVLYVADEIELSSVESPGADNWKSLDAIERDYILRALKETNWRISGHKGAALLLDINPSTLRGRMRKLNIIRK